jgi:VRR-NUC domain
MKHLEDNIQAACCRWFAYEYPGIKLIHTPNGGHRNALEAARFKRQGVTPGVPDLFLMKSANGFHGLFIEVKSETGKLSEYQKEMLAYLDSMQYKTAVIRSVDEFIKVVNEYFKS